MKIGRLDVEGARGGGALFGSAIIEQYRRCEESVEETLIDMYLARVPSRRVDDIPPAS